ncbi:amidohydrolase [Microdochium trichocladiopsis]|uniref:Amidohydrolase n=1 Tax=Microdochium trichocladiopsis TaxID=1682393 RepID=A0A9P8Y2S4_9PEZI|nr:amidohydrolase [Microdochium trichocladiopsis]KAH7027843.1 amidohydrolase [Microdochium trichocladiopsis]
MTRIRSPDGLGWPSTAPSPAPTSTETQNSWAKGSKPWQLPPRKVYMLRNANVVDPLNGVLLMDRDIILRDGLIMAVCETSEHGGVAVLDGEDVTVVDLEHKFVCPGLIDCHVHLSSVPGIGTGNLASAMPRDVAESLLRQPFLCKEVLKRGFTTLRDTGGATLALKEAIADEVFPGPRLFIANQALSQTGGHGDSRGSHDHSSISCCGQSRPGLSVVCDGVSDCIRAAREQLRTGADFIKIMASGGVASPTDRLTNTQFTASEIRAICEVAGSYGTYVTAHAYTPAAIRHAVENGVRGIEHGNLIDRDTAKYMAEKKVWFTPTLVTYEAMADRDRYPGFLPPENANKNRAILEAGLRSVELARDAGVRICLGSDLLGSLWAEQSREFAIRRRILSSLDVVRSATVNAAEMLGQGNNLGQVKAGYLADLLVLGTNPLEDVSSLATPDTSILAVVKDGRVWHSQWSRLPIDTA